MSFTAELPHSVRSMLLAEEICHMADSMQMMSVAEGIERPDQFEALNKVGWAYGQGYMFAPPQCAEKCDELLALPTLLTMGA
jgi:sensor c-di-GMP phosphodiesterase-like protein